VTELKDIGELGLIQGLAALFSPINPRVLKGIGDDCAVLDGDGESLLLTTDILVEGVHFLKGTDPARLAKKLLAVNLSDIAAMGGRGKAALLSAALPPETPLSFWETLASTLAEEFAGRKLDLLGGDTSSSPGPIVLNLVLLGRADPDKVVYRAGAGANDLVYVSRTLGDSAAGLDLIKSPELKIAPDVQKYLRAAQETPRAEEELGPFLAETGLVTAMIDVSDGLTTDLTHLAEASGLGAEVFLDSLPVSDQVRTLGKLLDLDPVEWALNGGEDLALLFTVPPEKEFDLKQRVGKTFNRKLWKVGRMTSALGLAGVTGKTSKPLTGRGYEHFRSEKD